MSNLINNCLKQIVDLDKRIQAEKAGIQKEVDHIEEETNKRIDDMKVQLLDKTQAETEKLYQEQMAEAEINRLETIEQAQEEANKLNQIYEENKDQAADLVLDYLLGN